MTKFANVSVKNPLDDLADQQQHGLDRFESIHKNMRRLQAERDAQTADQDQTGTSDIAYTKPKHTLEDLYDMYLRADDHAKTYVSVDQGYIDLKNLVSYARKHPHGFDISTYESIIQQTEMDGMEHVERLVDSKVSTYEHQIQLVSSKIHEQIDTARDVSMQIDMLALTDKELIDLDFVSGRNDISLTSITSHNHVSSMMPSSMLTPLSVLPTQIQDNDSQEEQVESYQRLAGIYLNHDDHGVVKLTDYTDDMIEEIGILADVDSDSDVDVLYARGTSVYLKKHAATDPRTSHVGRSPKVFSMNKVLETIVPVKEISTFGYSPLSRFLQSSYPSAD